MPSWRFLILFLLLAHCLIWPANTAWGGNRTMVERSVRKLDLLNSELLKQETQIPQYGRLELKADARYGAGEKVDMHVYSRKTYTVTDEPIRFNGKQTTLLSE